MADDGMDLDEKDFGLSSLKKLKDTVKSCVYTLMSGDEDEEEKEMDRTDQYDFGHSQRVSQEDHSECDCLAVAITSHGEKYTQVDPRRYNVSVERDIILGSQGAVYTEELVEKFSDDNCPSLRGKPRIFLLQACRGVMLDPGVTVTEDMDVVDAMTEPEYTISPAPCFKDFCIVYATPPGFYAFRRPTTGSWFVTGLRDVIENADLTKHNLLQLMTKVINHVARQFESHSPQLDIDGKKQSGCIYSMLTKDVYFSPKPLGDEPL
ncbi:caspase-7-like isoform X3 [Haliotis rufescens]|uniref:caspase-7-like isoform X3 n=1 Tax=Haliotis rufescens TaxID=6454 RepID=UPI001EB09ED9|nr:caspase-7-like isoform X3 [Haliotis rufescens]